MLSTLAHHIPNFNPPPLAYAKNDLVSHGADVEGKRECYGAYNDTSGQGWGPGYQYTCIHSGVIGDTDLTTAWYNYPLASAGTIISENSTSTEPAENITKATESVCPKGWTMPSYAQIRSIGNSSADYAPNFSPVLGGNYYNGALHNESRFGNWWGSEKYNGASRYTLKYNGSNLLTNFGSRQNGLYIRCVQKS